MPLLILPRQMILTALITLNAGEWDAADQTAAFKTAYRSLNELKIDLSDSTALQTIKDAQCEQTLPKPECINDLEGKGKIFNYSRLPRFLERKISKLGQKTWSWHCLRHRRASIWANNGMNLFEISHRLGHTNLKTTQGYLQLLGFTKF